MSWYNPTTWPHDIEKAYNDAADAVNSATGWVDDNIIEPTAHYASDAYKDTSKALTDAANYSYSLAANPQATAETMAHTIEDCATSTAEAGWDALPSDYQNYANEAAHYIEEGAEAVEKFGEEAYAWASANACRIGLPLALNTAIIAAFTYKGPEDPNAPAIFSINGMALAASAAATSAAKYGAAVGIAAVLTPVIYAIPGVKGQISKDLLNSCLVSAIDDSLEVSMIAWCTPFSLGVMIAGFSVPIITMLVCDGVTKKDTGMVKSAAKGKDPITGTFGHNSAKMTLVNRQLIEQQNLDTNTKKHLPVHRVTNGAYCNYMNNNSVWPTDNRETWEGHITVNIPLAGYYTLVVAVDNEAIVYVGKQQILHWSRFDTTSQARVFMPAGENKISWKAWNYYGKASGNNPAGLSIFMESELDEKEIKEAIQNQKQADDQAAQLEQSEKQKQAEYHSNGWVKPSTSNSESENSNVWADPSTWSKEPKYTTMPVDNNIKVK